MLYLAAVFFTRSTAKSLVAQLVRIPMQPLILSFMQQ